MGISKLISKTSPIFWGSLIFVFNISCNSSQIQYIIEKRTDSLNNFKEIDDNSEIFVFGSQILSFNQQPCYSVYLKSQDTISLLELKSGQVKKNIAIKEEAFSISTLDSSIYIFYEDKNYFRRVDICKADASEYKISFHELIPFFSDSFFIATSRTNGIHVMDSDKFFIPYRVENGLKSMLDTFAYIYFNKNNYSASYKFIEYENPKHYDFLYKTVTDYNRKSNIFICGFEKSNLISIVDLKTKHVRKILLDNFKSIDYPKEKIKDLTFIRKYLKENDKLQKITSDKDGNLFIILKYSESNLFKHRIYYFQNKSDKLYHKDINYIIYPNLSFIKSNSLYVPNSNSYSIFTFNDSLSKQAN